MTQAALTELLTYTPYEDDLALPGIHFRWELPDRERPIPIPLCWYVEGQQRGATIEEWLVSVDHEALPAVTVTDHQDVVDCQECRDWMHA